MNRSRFPAVLAALAAGALVLSGCAAKQPEKAIPREGCLATYVDAQGRALRVRCIFRDGTVADFQRERVIE